MIYFSAADGILFPLCFLVCYLIIRQRARKQKDPKLARLYFRAFYFKVVCVFGFTIVTAFYFKGGDTVLYYYAIQDLRNAVADNINNFWPALTTHKITQQSALFNFFYYDENPYDLTYNYMVSAHNFFPPRLGLIPSYIFGNSYLCINMCFGFFALGGAIRLFKAFYYFYPTLYKELAFTCIFLPGVAFWSAGLLKDPVTFGCIGYIFYAFVNIFFRKTNYKSSIAWILFCGYLLFTIKIYILLVLILSLLIWQFVEFNRTIKDKTLRGIFTVMTFTVGAIVGYFMLQYITSLEAAQQYQIDNLLANAEKERQGYAAVAQKFQGDSHFNIRTSNPILMIFDGFVATFYRPFVWEINTPIALLSAIESTAFLFLTLYFLFKKGVKSFFSLIFSDGRIIMCFVFATIFAIAVGTSTANFGALSRYKIPCTPFYLIMLFLIYYRAKQPYPVWLHKIIDFTVPSNKNAKYVRHSRFYQP